MAQREDGRVPIPDIDPFTKVEIKDRERYPYEEWDISGIRGLTQIKILETTPGGDLQRPTKGVWWLPPTYQVLSKPGEGRPKKAAVKAAEIATTRAHTDVRTAQGIAQHTHQFSSKSEPETPKEIPLPLVVVPKPELKSSFTTVSSSSPRSYAEVFSFSSTSSSSSSSSPEQKLAAQTGSSTSSGGSIDQFTGYPMKAERGGWVITVGKFDFRRNTDGDNAVYTYNGNYDILTKTEKKSVNKIRTELNNKGSSGVRAPMVSSLSTGVALGGKSSGKSAILEGKTPKGGSERSRAYREGSEGGEIKRFTLPLSSRSSTSSENPENKVSPSLKMSNALSYGRVPKNTISAYFSGLQRPEARGVTQERSVSVELKDALNRGRRVFCLWTINLPKPLTATVEIHGDMGTPELFINGEQTSIEQFRIAFTRNRRGLAAAISATQDRNLAINVKTIQDYLKIEEKRIPDYEAMKAGFEADIRAASLAGDRDQVNTLIKGLSKLEKRAAVLQRITKEDKQVTIPYRDAQYEGFAYQELITQKDIETIMSANGYDFVVARDAINVMINSYIRNVLDTATILTRQEPSETEAKNTEVMTLFNAVRGLTNARRFIKPIEVNPVVIKKTAHVDPTPAAWELAPQQPLRIMDPNPQRGSTINYPEMPNGEHYGIADTPQFQFVNPDGGKGRSLPPPGISGKGYDKAVDDYNKGAEGRKIEEEISEHY